jgi:voltage-gated potassium channel
MAADGGTERDPDDLAPGAGSGVTADLDAERERLLAQVEAVADPLMFALGLVFLLLLLVQVGALPVTADEQRFLDRADNVIYAAFVADFGLRLLIVPDRAAWIRKNWLLAVSLLLPALRPLRLVRIAPALATIHTAALVGGANKALAALRKMLRGRAFLYLVVVTVLVVVVGAGAVLQLDRGHHDTPFTSFGEALWWAATLVTTVNTGDDPVSGWGRVVAVMMRVYAVGVFGYLTASIASYFIAQVSASDARSSATAPASTSSPRPQSGAQ